MMGFDSRANYALGLPRSQTSTGSLLCAASPSNPAFCCNEPSASVVTLVEMMGFEPMTPCLQGRCSPSWATPPFFNGVVPSPYLRLGRTDFSALLYRVSIGLSSRTVARKVFSPLQSLTSVFGMGTGGPSAFVTLTIFSFKVLFLDPWKLNNISFRQPCVNKS